MRFRTDTSDEKFIGVGTIIQQGNSEKWRIIGDGSNAHIHLVQLFSKFIVKTLQVERPSAITRTEFDMLMEFTGCTMSDFTFHSSDVVDVAVSKLKY